MPAGDEQHAVEDTNAANADASQGVPSVHSLDWTHHPWKAAPLRMVALFAVNLGVVAIVYFTFAEKVFALLALLVMFGSTMSIYLPIRYRFTPEGVTVFFLGVPSFRPWKHYHQAYVHENGVFLTSMPRPSRLDPFRGHFLKYAGNREAVVNYVRRFIPKKQ